MSSDHHCSDVLDVRRVGTDITAKIQLSAGQSAFGWLLTANSIILSVVASFLPWYAEGALYTLFFNIFAFGFFIAVPDILFLPYMKKSIARVEAAGFRRMEWIGYLGLTLVLFGLFTWLPVRLFSVVAKAEPRFTAEFFLKAIACAFASDIPFFPLHRALHHQLSKLHMLHHLCVDTSLASTFLIGPEDAVMELLGPGCAVMLVTLGVMGDAWVHLGATAIMTAWYIISHDPQVKLQHYYHHAHCDSRYNGYVPLKTVHDPKDKVRAEVFKIRQQEREAAKRQQQ